MNLQTSMNGSVRLYAFSVLGGAEEMEFRSLKQAWCNASRFAEDILLSPADDLVLIEAHVLTSLGCLLARSVALAQSPVSIYKNKGGKDL